MAQSTKKTPDHDTSGVPSAIFGLIASQIRDAICLQDINGNVEWMNPACEEMFGWSLAETRGRKAIDFIGLPGQRRPGTDAGTFTYDLGSRIFVDHIVREFQRRDRSRFWVQQSFSVLDPGPEHGAHKIVITCRDITDEVRGEQSLRQAHANLEFAVSHDDLTRLANRKRLDQYLQTDDLRTAISQNTVGVLQVDIHKFKDINDTAGHAAGDATLRHVAAALRRHCAPNELACRVGGDEFLLVCLHCRGEDDLTARADALRREVELPTTWHDQNIAIEVSVGASLAQPGCATGADLIQRASLALHTAKQDGPGQIALYNDRMGQAYHARMQLMQELRAALKENQFEIYLQPQLQLSTITVRGCEALIRWNHPERGVLTPGQFLPAAEAAGLAADLDYVAMNLSLDAMVALREEGFGDLHFSLNVSSSILGDVNYPGLLDWAMQSRDIDPARICIEILETTILEGGGIEIATAIERLKRLGVRISLDDFGTGYAGLAHMSSFDIDEIKLDRSMIARLDDDDRNRLIVRFIIRLCAMLDIGVVAEGVETSQQLAILRRIGRPLIQGYGLARPMPLSDMIEWLRCSDIAAQLPGFDKPATADVSDLNRHRAGSA